MQLPCKQIGCQGVVNFEKDDKVIGNYTFQSLNNGSLKIKVKGGIQEGKTVGILKIIQSEHAELPKQSVYFNRNQETKISQKDRFYLTCTEGHTLIYEINIQDE